MTGVPSLHQRRAVITTLADVTPEWLTSVLRRSGYSESEVVGLELESGESSFCVKAHLRPIYRGAPGPDRLFLKFSKLRHAASTPETGHEVAFYHSIAPHTPAVALVRCYDAAYDPGQHRLHVLLDDMSESHTCEEPSQLPLAQAHAEMVVDSLAQVHAAWWERPPFELAGQAWPSAVELEDRIARVRTQVGQFVAFLGGRLSTARQDLFRSVLAALPALYKRLLDPRGFSVVHDDVHVGNVMLPRTPEVETVRLIDWQTWHVDLAVKDLAHMMAVFWYPDVRSRLEVTLLERYHAQLAIAGVRSYSWDDLWQDYRLCVLRKLFLPPHQWATGHHPNIWWNHLERIMLAFEDLACVDLLAADRQGAVS